MTAVGAGTAGVEAQSSLNTGESERSSLVECCRTEFFIEAEAVIAAVGEDNKLATELLSLAESGDATEQGDKS